MVEVKQVGATNGICKTVALRNGRCVIEALRPSKSALNIETVRHALLNLGHQSVVIGISQPVRGLDVAEIGIDPLVLRVNAGGAKWTGPQPACGGEGGLHNIVFRGLRHHVHSTSAYVAGAHGKARSELALEIEVPFLHIVSFRVILELGAAKARGYARQLRIAYGRKQTGGRAIKGTGSHFEKGLSLRALGRDLIIQRKDIEHAEAT